MSLRLAFAVCTVILCSAVLSAQTKAKELSLNGFSIVDADTIRLEGERRDVRLVGFNAPETTRAKCDGERALGYAAARRLKEIVQGAKLDFDFVPCACRPGTQGTHACNYGRYCGTLKANGTDVGTLLISENLAVPFVCGETRCPPTPRPWCEKGSQGR